MSELVTRVDPTVLVRVVDACKRLGSRGVAVFDLDSTLLDNRPRQARILREFGAAAKVAPLAASEPKHWTSWDIKDAMRAAGMSAEQIDQHGDAAKSFSRERFFTSEYAAIDDAVNGAVAYVEQLVETGVQIAYCAGRHEQMREGSVASFCSCVAWPRRRRRPCSCGG